MIAFRGTVTFEPPTNGHALLGLQRFDIAPQHVLLPDMAATVSAKRRAIFGPDDVIRRVVELKVIPEEPAWRVVQRLLDEHDARSRAATPTTPREEAVA